MLNISVLEDQPNGKVIHDVLMNFEAQTEPIGLVEIMTITKVVLPVYPSLKIETREVLHRLISNSYTFFAQLVSFTLSIPTDQSESAIYKAVIKDVLTLHPECFNNYVVQFTNTKTERKNLKALFFGSKVYNVLSSEVDIIWYLERLRTQWQFGFEYNKYSLSVYEDPMFAEFLVPLLVLHPILAVDTMFNQLFLTNDENFQIFKTIVLNATVLDQQRLINTFFLPYLDINVNEANYKTVSLILRQFPLHRIIDLNIIMEFKSLIFQELVIRLLPKALNSRITLQLMRKFGEGVEDENICNLIVIVLRYQMDSSHRDAMSQNSKFLDAVTSRLKHKDNLFRERTMYIAKLVSNGELEYESDFVIEIPDLDLMEDDTHINYSSLRNTKPKQGSFKEVSTLASSTTELSLKDDSDDDDYDSDDDSSRDIVFLKDLVKKYESLNNNQRTRHVPLLKLTVKLFRQKKDFPLEVAYYSSSLLSSITCLNNDLDEARFEEWRINALVSIVVITPDKVTSLLKILFSSELSLQQRMSILSSVGLSARELRGHDDKSIAKPQFDFPTSRLPWDNNKEPLIENLEGHKGAENDSIKSTKTVWRSKKLETNKKIENKNNFKLYCRLFFYPLAHAWLNGIDLGTYDELFKHHYLMTLGIVYQCAYPVHDYESMTQLMEQITMQASQQGIRMERI